MRTLIIAPGGSGRHVKAVNRSHNAPISVDERMAGAQNPHRQRFAAGRGAYLDPIQNRRTSSGREVQTEEPVAVWRDVFEYLLVGDIDSSGILRDIEPGHHPRAVDRDIELALRVRANRGAVEGFGEVKMQLVAPLRQRDRVTETPPPARLN